MKSPEEQFSSMSPQITSAIRLAENGQHRWQDSNRFLSVRFGCQDDVIRAVLHVGRGNGKSNERLSDVFKSKERRDSPNLNTGESPKIIFNCRPRSAHDGQHWDVVRSQMETEKIPSFAIFRNREVPFERVRFELFKRRKIEKMMRKSRAVGISTFLSLWFWRPWIKHDNAKFGGPR